MQTGTNMISTVKVFRGIDRLQDSTDQKIAPIELAEGIVLRPRGGFSRAPEFKRLWGIVSLANLKDSLGISKNDLTCCVKLVHEGETFLAFHDYLNDLGLGIFYAGKDTEFTEVLSGGPTLLAENPTVQVLWRGLSPRVKWNGALIAGKLYLGNGIDLNLAYDSASNTIGIMGANVAPLSPTLNLTNIISESREQSFLDVNGLHFEADRRLGGLKGNEVTVTICGGASDYFTSEISGQGTFCDPYEYVVTCPSPLPTNEQLAAFITRDPKATGVLKCEYTASASSQAPLFPKIYLSNGRDQTPPYHSGVSSESFEPATTEYIRFGVKVLLTYIREDDRLGVVESAPSATVMVETARSGMTAHAVQVSIQKDEDSPEAAGWTGIRVYAAETCLDCVCDRKRQWLRLFELPNETQMVTIYPWHTNARARTDLARDGLLINEGEIFSARPPEPVKAFVYANRRIYMAGNDKQPLKIFFTKEQTSEKSLIETTHESLTCDVIPQGNGSEKITALAAFRGGVMAFASNTAFNPQDQSAQNILSAPMNEQAGVNWNNGYYYYLGNDFNLYRIHTLPTDREAKPIDSLVSDKISGYIREFADVTDSISPHTALDSVNRIWWIWVRSRFEGFISFAFDFDKNELTGPFYFPQFAGVTSISPSDGRFIGATTRGELFVWNLKKLSTSSLQFSNTSGVQLVDSHSTSIDPENYQGFGILFFKNGKSLLKAQTLRLQTGWMNFEKPEIQKGFYEFHWTTVKNSSGIVFLRFETDERIFKNIYYGDVFGKEHHKVLTLLYGHALRVTFTALLEDDKDFAVRDWSINWIKQ